MSSPARVDVHDGFRTGTYAAYPASLSQRRLWFLNELQGPTAAYNVNIGLWFYGPLDLGALQASVQAIVDRHETLRTKFALHKGELIQLVESTLEILLPLTDLSDLEQPYPTAYQFAQQEVAEPFDLSKGPLFRAKLLRIRPEEHVFLCTMHHTVTDAWSMQTFTKELAAIYQSKTNQGDLLLPHLTIQYGDYAEWQRQLLETDFAENQLAYWKGMLEGAPSLLHLPTDHPRPAEQTLEGQSRTFAVPGEIIAAATSLANQQRVTIFMLLLAAFKVLLYRYSGQSDICVGVPVAGRSRLETEPLIGFFVDTLVFRDELSGNPRFTDVVAKVRETTLGALANADVPFEKVVEALHPKRNLSYNPLFQVMFSVIKSAIRTHTFGNMVAYPYVVEPNSSILDLCATFIEDSDSKWWLQIDFDTSLFKMERISRMFDDYMDVLRQVIANPQAHVDSLTILNGAMVPSSELTHDKQDEFSSSRSVDRLCESADLNEREVLTEIWKDVLGLEKVGMHDNFFDIGGHSLLAAHLTAQIRQVTGHTIPVSAIFRAPTIAALAALLRDDTASRPDPMLMRLSQGENKIPFFAIVPPGVDSLGYALLARHLGPQHPVYKIQAAGAAVWERPFEKEEIRVLAEQYVSAMRTVQPRGPYCLGGMCNGVLIAQEMIQQLERQREKVSLFAILDTWVLENSQVKILWAMDYYKARLRRLRHLSVREQFTLAGRTLGRLMSRREDRRTKWGEAYWPGEHFQAPQFNAPILLFKRPRQPYFYVRDPEMGWGDRTSGGVEICEVNASHYELLREPYVLAISQKLSERLDAANQDARNCMLSVPVSQFRTEPDLSSSIAESVA